MRTGYRWAAALLVLVALSVAATACGSDGSDDSSGLPAEDGSGGVYLALGDSIAAGTGATNAAGTSYVALVAEALRGRFGDTLETESLAVGGHTTQDLIDEQLPAAVERLEQGDVRLMTVTIAGNDLNQLAPHEACQQDPSQPACPIEDVLLEIEQRLSVILEQLREAGPDATIVIQVYPNLFSGTGHQFEEQAETAFGLLNDVIVDAAGRYDVLVADPRQAFAGRGGDLTHILDATPDNHPNDAGYRVIANAFLEALGLSTTDEGTD